VAQPPITRPPEKKIENAASGILGCDAIWAFDPSAAYFGMKEWAELLLEAFEKERHRAVEAETRVIKTEDELKVMREWLKK